MTRNSPMYVLKKGVRLVVANVNLITYYMSIDKYLEGDGSSFAKFVKSLI
jgi:hypothetical protein